MIDRLRRRCARAHHLLVKGLRVASVPAYWRGLRHGVAASIEHHGVAFTYDFGSVIDVGANRGQFSLFARRRFPRAEIYAFEPLAAPAALHRLVTAGDPHVTLTMTALGAAPGRVTIHVTDRDDSSSVFRLTEEAGTRTGLREVASVEVPITTLDAAFAGAVPARPCLLKLDVQGAELDVLHGAQALLREVDEVLVEVSFVPQYANQPLVDEVLAFLVDAGFRWAGIGSVSRDARGACLQADLLLTRREA